MAYGTPSGADAPADNPNMAMGKDDLYSDDADAGAGEGEEAEPKDEAKAEGEGDSVEATLPKSILAGKEFKVGDEVVLKITGMHDNEISVAYAPAKPEGEEKEAAAEPESGSQMPAASEGSDYD